MERVVTHPFSIACAVSCDVTFCKFCNMTATLPLQVHKGKITQGNKSTTANSKITSSMLGSCDRMAPLVVVLDIEGYTGGKPLLTPRRPQAPPVVSSFELMGR